MHRVLCFFVTEFPEKRNFERVMDRFNRTDTVSCEKKEQVKEDLYSHLTKDDYFLWRYVKNEVYKMHVATRENLKNKMRVEQQL